MPLVTINLLKGRPIEAKKAIADGIQAALVNTLGIPDADRYTLIREHDKDDFIHTPAYLDLSYSSDLLMVEIVFIEGRPDDAKKALLRDINDRLVATGFVLADDVFIVMSEVGRANISFGKGLAQRAM